MLPRGRGRSGTQLLEQNGLLTVQAEHANTRAAELEVQLQGILPNSDLDFYILLPFSPRISRRYAALHMPHDIFFYARMCAAC